MYENEWKIITFDDTEIEEHKFHQYKSPVLINDIDINKIVVSNRFSFSKHNLVTKMMKKIDFCAYSVQKWVYIKEVNLYIIKNI